tara:strand:- start:4304 stop:4603 length:300 start_codon:yes stop_codon:yes gene_type:complete
MSIDDASPDEWDEVYKRFKENKSGLWPVKDEVNNPVHYNKGGIECIQGIQAASTKEEFEGYLRGNIIKYVWRYRYKDNLKDLEKAKWYLNMLISEIKSK